VLLADLFEVSFGEGTLAAELDLNSDAPGHFGVELGDGHLGCRHRHEDVPTVGRFHGLRHLADLRAEDRLLDLGLRLAVLHVTEHEALRERQLFARVHVAARDHAELARDRIEIGSGKHLVAHLLGFAARPDQDVLGQDLLVLLPVELLDVHLRGFQLALGHLLDGGVGREAVLIGLDRRNEPRILAVLQLLRLLRHDFLVDDEFQEFALAREVERVGQEAAVHLDDALFEVAAGDRSPGDSGHDLVAVRRALPVARAGGDRGARHERQGAPLAGHGSSFAQWTARPAGSGSGPLRDSSSRVGLRGLSRRAPTCGPRLENRGAGKRPLS
jgi:hypothetical protein